jgi:signal peptide peptidase SppA
MRTNINNFPHFDQWFGAWAMEESRFWASYEFMRKMDLHLHLESGAVQAAQSRAESGGQMFAKRGGVALIAIHGQMMKQESSVGGGASTVLARRQIRAAIADPEIAAIQLHIDSPGGTVAGTKDLADDIAAAAQQKPVWSYIEDLGASAAYWIASQSTRISANPTALVGSIGTYGVVKDYSGAAAMEGVKAYVVRAGKFKGMGTPGTEVTQEQLAELQRSIDSLNEHFILAVSSGRKLGMDATRELADGRVHIAKEAKRLQLIDAVESFDQSLIRLEKESRRKPMSMAETVVPAEATLVTAGVDVAARETVVVTTSAKPAAQAVVIASHAEIKAGCPGCDANFIVAQLDANATLAQAQAAWMAEQQKRLAAAQEETKQAKAAATKPGVPAIADAKPAGKTEAAGKPGADFWAKVDEKTAKGIKKDEAIAQAAKEHPELHAAMIEEANAARAK